MHQKTSILNVLLLVCYVIVDGYNECEYHELAKCYRVHAAVFANADKNLQLNLPLKDVYCEAFKEMGHCFTSNKECVGEVIDFDRFVIVQYMLMDKKLGICQHTDIDKFESVLHANVKYRMKTAGLKEIEADKFSPCAAEINRKCASVYAKAEISGQRMCDVFENYFQCYESPGIPCEDKIYKDYVSNIHIMKIESRNETRLMPTVVPGC